jgi:DNA repair exonuclease SbcCD ATPase subunit
MIATGYNVAARILRRLAAASAVGAFAILGGCEYDRETSLARHARWRDVDDERLGRTRAQRELEIVRRETDEAIAAIGKAKVTAVERAAELRAVLADLDHQLTLLRAAEQDLVAAKTRATEIEKEMVPLRALETTVKQQQERLIVLQEQSAALATSVAAAEQALQQKQAELQPRLTALQAQLAATHQVASAVQAAEQALGEAAKVLPPAKPAEAPPAGQPPKK